LSHFVAALFHFGSKSFLLQIGHQIALQENVIVAGPEKYKFYCYSVFLCLLCEKKMREKTRDFISPVKAEDGVVVNDAKEPLLHLTR
jgi:hypothetical protein